MFLPLSGSLTMTTVNAAFGLGNNIGDYRGARWYRANATTGTFPSTGLDLNQFHSKGGTSPVTPGSQSFSSSGTFTVPLYATLTITAKGGSGGGGGGGGNIGSASAGTAGGTSSFGA